MNEAPAPESRTSPAAPADIDDLNSYQRKALAALADVGMDDPVALAADAAGVRTDTIDRWRKDSPAFNAAWNEATSKPSGARAALAAAGDEVDPDLDGE